MFRTTIALSLGVSLFAAAGCSKGDNDADDSAKAAAAAAPTPGPAVASADSSNRAGGLTDPNIVWILDQANVADSARGQVAQQKATDKDVKDFGKMMIGEHHALRQQGQQLAQKLGVTPTPPADTADQVQAKQEMDSLNATAKGKGWDKAYIDYEVRYHQHVLDVATTALGAAQNAELKSLIQQAAPVVQKHLDRAKQIQSKLGQ